MKLNKSNMPIVSLDIMKFIMAILVMLAHICSENVTVHPILKTFTSLYNFGVPFFFACSGFLFFSKIYNIERSQYLQCYIKFSRRILLMYLAWSIIYFSFVLASWALETPSTETLLKYFHKSLVLTTYKTIWFLPALWIGTSLVFLLLYKGLSAKKTLIISFLFYLFGAFGYSYLPLSNNNSILEFIYNQYNNLFLTTRNGFFAGFPFVAIGMYIAFNGSETRKKYGVFAVIFSILYIVEAFAIKYRLHVGVDMGLMLIPATYFILKYLLNIRLEPKNIYLKLRNLSMLIFLGQRLFITAIPSILPVYIMERITLNPYIGLLFFSSLTILFSLIIENLSKKYTWLNILW